MTLCKLDRLIMEYIVAKKMTYLSTYGEKKEKLVEYIIVPKHVTITHTCTTQNMGSLLILQQYILIEKCQ